MRALWVEGKRPGVNFHEMGLSSDPNKTVAIPSFKNERLKYAKIVNGFVEEELSDEEHKADSKPRSRAHVAEQLEQLSKMRGESMMRCVIAYILSLFDLLLIVASLFADCPKVWWPILAIFWISTNSIIRQWSQTEKITIS